MPRGRKKVLPESIEEKITRLNAEIEEMTATLKEKKKELRQAIKDKAEEEKIAAEKKAAEDKAKIVEAVEKAMSEGGKTLEDVLKLLK